MSLISPRVKVFMLTILYSGVVTLVTFLLAYPLAYYLAKIVSPKSLPTLFLLLFVPLVGVRSAAVVCVVDHSGAEGAAECGADGTGADRQRNPLDRRLLAR